MENVYSEVLNGNDHTNIYEHNSEYYKGDYNSWSAYKHLHKGYKDIVDMQPGKYFYACPYMSFGDYDNSCAVERANVKEFLKMFPEQLNKDYYHVTGAYSSESIFIDITSTDAEIIECLNALLQYPAINDESVSEMEIEMENESYDSYIKGDLLTAIKKKFDGWDIECTDDQKLQDWYYELKETTNTEFRVESGGNGYIDIDRLIANVTEVPTFLTIDFND